MAKRNAKGQLQKGHAGLKPKGAISQKTKDWDEMRDFIKGDLVPKYVDKVKNLMDSPDLNIQVVGMEKMLHILEYFAPKLSRAEVDNKGEQQLTIRHVTDE